jgi:hypothetical protein
VVEGVGCHQGVLDQYLDRVVNGYQHQHCQDQDRAEQVCDGCDPNWEAQELVDPLTLNNYSFPLSRMIVDILVSIAGSMAGHISLREASCEAMGEGFWERSSEAPQEATISPSPSTESFSSQVIPMAIWHT